MESGSSGNCAVGDYMTHPAFLSIPSTGFWVGKFKASIQEENIQYKPNEVMWTGMTLGNAFKQSYEYQRRLDSHLTKNTEWGAITYLTNSKFGINQIIQLNTNTEKRTGYAANSDDGIIPSEESSPYNTEIGYTSSSSGNITGVYDLSGGVAEFVMGINYDRSGLESREDLREIYNIEDVYPDFYENSNFTKYYDLYYGESLQSFSKRILGDATGEMGPFGTIAITDRQGSSWYQSYSYFVNNTDPFFIRCGPTLNVLHENNLAIHTSRMGGGLMNQSFRVVLTPMKD